MCPMIPMATTTSIYASTYLFFFFPSLSSFFFSFFYFLRFSMRRVIDIGTIGTIGTEIRNESHQKCFLRRFRRKKNKFLRSSISGHLPDQNGSSSILEIPCKPPSRIAVQKVDGGRSLVTKTHRMHTDWQTRSLTSPARSARSGMFWLDSFPTCSLPMPLRTLPTE